MVVHASYDLQKLSFQIICNCDVNQATSKDHILVAFVNLHQAILVKIILLALNKQKNIFIKIKRIM